MTRDEGLAQVEEALGYSFKDRELLRRALIHASAGPVNNGALACLGDRIWNVWVARWVWEQNPDATKGSMTYKINGLVSGSKQAEIFFGLNLHEHLLVGGAIHGSGGEVQVSMASTAMEALVAAVELDGGREEAEAMLERLLGGAFIEAPRADLGCPS